MSEQDNGGIPSPRRGRRAAAAPDGPDTTDPYVREVLDLAAAKPGAREDEPVDFDRLIAEDDDAPPDFEMLARREEETRGSLGGFAVYGDPAPAVPPVRARPAAAAPESGSGPAAPVPGALADIPVYGEPGPGTLTGIPVYGDPAVSSEPRSGIGPADGTRDVGVTEKPNFYEDPSASAPKHEVRFRPGSSYSPGNRNAYRVDARGVPVFAPGWTAAAVAGKFSVARTVRFSLAGAMIAAAAGMAALGVGANPDYLDIKASGTQVQAKVVSVVTTSEQDTAADVAVDRLGVITTETATVEFALDGIRHRHELTSSSEGGAALMGAGATWANGSLVDMYVDPEDPAKAVVVDDKQLERINYFTLIPLVPAALFAAAGTAAHVNTRKMRAVAAAAG